MAKLKNLAPAFARMARLEKIVQEAYHKRDVELKYVATEGKRVALAAIRKAGWKRGEMIDIDVDMIHRARSIAILSDGQEVPVTTWLGADGGEVDPSGAISCVCGPDFDGKWYVVNLAMFTGKVH